MKSVYEYTDFRLYLKEFLKEKKEKNSRYSLRVLSDKCGFKARDYILRLINNQRNLSQAGIYKLCKGLGLKGNEAVFFEDLVVFNQAKTVAEKEHYYFRMMKSRKFVNAHILKKDQFSYFSKWYHCAIRSLLPVIDFKDNYAELGKFLEPPITASEAKKSVQLLLTLGLLKKNESGQYSVATSAVTTGDEVKSLALALFHKTSLDLAKRSIDTQIASNRDISGITASVSEKGFKKIKSEIQRFRKTILSITSEDSAEDRVIQFNIQCFPISKTRKIV